ncbi:MAG TPA: hypothetical protein V6C89_00720 [Drouetiella sp.]
MLMNFLSQCTPGLLTALVIATSSAFTLAPEASCKITAARKHSLTGEYDYKRGRNEGELYIKQLASRKIQFALKCLWIGNPETGDVHTGQASGLLNLNPDNTAIYKNPDGLTLKFAFSPRKCVVQCLDGYSVFGGINVDPDGKYNKVSSKIPTAGNLEAYQ